MRYYNYMIRRTAMLLILLMAGWAGCPLSAQTVVSVDVDPSRNLAGETSGANIQPLSSFDILQYGISFEFSTGSGTTAPAYYANGDAVRLYNGNTFKLYSSSSYVIESVEFEVANYKQTEQTLTSTTGVVSYDSETCNFTWTNTARVAEASFNINNTQLRFTGVVLTLVGETPNQWKAYFTNDNNWDNVMTWIWDNGNDAKNYTGGIWPGAQCQIEEVNGVEYWTYSFSTGDDLISPMIIFNNGDNGYQTEDLPLVNNGIYDSYGFTGVTIETIDGLKSPVFSQASCDFYQSFELTITDINDPATTIIYTLDGTTPSADNGTIYTAPITIPTGQSITVKAVCVNETGVSAVASVHYNFVPKHLLSVKFANKNGVNYLFYSTNTEYGQWNTEHSALVTEGENVYLGFELNYNYKLRSVSLNGQVQTVDANYPYLEFVMPQSDVEIIIDTEFDPTSPGDPNASITKKYKLMLVSNPIGACTFSQSGSAEYAEGAQVYVSAYTNSGYVFTGWTKDGETINTNYGFYYTMPAHDVVLTANYVYSPANPADPDQPKLMHPLTVIASPKGSGTFSTSGSKIAYGDEYYVRATPRQGYKFKGWIVNGVAQEETSTYLTGVMTEAGAQVVGLFVFDPTSPSEPNPNSYDAATGRMIVDHFATGSLFSAIQELLGYTDYDGVTSLLVKGKINSNDLNNLSWLTMLQSLDLSRTGGVSQIPSYCFTSMGLSNIVLPSTITSIGSYAFSNCENLVSLTIYSQEPPACNSSTFSEFTNKDNCTVYVPASAIELYSNADYWKDFAILPITNDAHVLQVNLPADAADGRYKNNPLEIVNINTGVRQKYVISDRLLYTFNGLQKDEQYNIYMFSQAGLEIGRIENVVIPDQDIEVTFDNLRSLHTVYAKVFTPVGSNVTEQVTVEWLKPLADGASTYLRKAVSLGEIPEGQQLICRVTLDNKLGVVYANPDDVEFTVGAGYNTCTVTLAPFRSIELTGSVVDGDDVALSGASVSVNQTLNDKYSKTYTAKTDRNGKWNITVLDAPETRLTYAATECVNVNQTIGAFAADVDNLDLGKTVMKSIVGARVNYGFTYHAAGSEEVQDYYSDYQNVAISVYNVTQNRAHTEVSLQYPILAVLDENISVGDVLKLTATSKTGAFNAIDEVVTIGDDQRAEVTFDIVGKGGIAASFEMTDNPAVIAMLYSDSGELLKKVTYSEAKATFTDLDDGDYTLVSMGQSDLMNSILRLSAYSEIGLAEGKDYVKNAVKVQSGQLAEVKIAEVPAFDESLFYYTNSATSFSSNKSSITTGNYLTLRSTIDFKGVYKDDISNVALIVDLPEACDFVEQSVIQGPNLLPYTFDNNRLTVQLGNNYRSQTRFCVIPTAGGSFNATASIVFDYNGKTITQPIGSALAEIKDIEIFVPVVISDNHFNVTGTSVSQSSIEIVEENEIIGRGKSNGTGYFKIACTLDNPYNLSAHEVCAHISTPNNNVLISESKSLTYNQKAVKVQRVIMTEGSNKVVFDFENPDSEDKYYYYTFGKFTFLIEFDSPKLVNNVILYIHTTSGDVEAYEATYDTAKDVWFVTAEFSTKSLPLNVSVDFEAETSSEYDSRIFDDTKSELAYQLFESQEARASFNEDIVKEDTFDEIDAIISEALSEDTDYEHLSNLIASSLPEGISPKLMTDEEFAQVKADVDAVSSEWDTLYQPYLAEEIINYVYADPEFDATTDNSFVVPTSDGHKIIKQRTLNTIDEVSLLNQGFDEYTLSAGNKFFILITSNEIIVIDALNLKEYSIIIAPNANEQQYRVSGQVAGYAQCGKSVTQLVSDLSNINSDRPKAIKATYIILKLLDALKCYYEGLYAHSKALTESKIANFLTKQSSLLEAELAKEKVVTQHIDELNRWLSKSYGDYLHYQELIKSVEANPALSLAEKERRIRIYEGAMAECLRNCEGHTQSIAQAEAVLKNISKNVKKFQKAVEWTKKAQNTIKQAYDACPAKLVRKMKMPKWLRIGGKAAGEFGTFVQVASFAMNCWDIHDDLVEWCKVIDAIDAKIPCEANPQGAENLRDEIYSKSDSYFYKYIGIMSGEVASIVFSIAGGVPLVSPTWYLEIITWAATEISRSNVSNGSKEIRNALLKQINELKCKKENDCGKPGQPACQKDNGGGNDGKTGPGGKGGDHKSGNSDTKYGIDPSGYVYEAVPDNRVEGVQATIYYKETTEDMYGDLHEEVVLWNAEEYAQKNPLFTDENGMYRWDVPQGLWQVKFEKDGYVTAYSEWLPVPPPQLDVNIGIVQNKQPELVEARAYEEGVEVQFDKYMDLSTLTTANIYVTANGEKLSGTIRMIDSALADEYASEDDADAVRYASRVRFVPDDKLSATTGEIRLTVSRNVLSYAGIPMTETFTQVLDVEKEVQIVYAEDVKVLYGGEKAVTVYALPYEAAVGRKLHIANSSDLIASIDVTEAILDEEGKAVVTVTGDLPGRAQLTFTIDDVNATGECAVDVVTEIITAEAPTASRASGTAVYRGTKVELASESKNATIYFTTDGSCPCDENGTRRKYTVPIIINDDTQIIAMTSVGSGDDDVSETVQFNYTLKRSDMDFQMPEGWTWMSHNFECAIAPTALTSDDGILRILSQTQEVIRDPQLGMVGTLTELAASESYKVETTTATARQRLSDVAWNPANPIGLNAGWNWLGYPVSQTMSVDEAFATTNAETLDVVVGQNGFAQFDGENWVGTLETMSPGMGYMYQSQSAKNVVYNTSIVSTASARYVAGISNSLPLVLDIHKYGTIMPVVATINDANGVALDNEDYQVVAFSGSECRGIGRVVKGRVMMNVYGNVNDHITFQVTDADGENSFANDATLSFSETVVGDVFNPYVITINGKSGIADVDYDGNIEVTVEGDMLHIKGIATDDIALVEIYDMKGTKLIRETNVIDGCIRISALTSGAYIVIVNANGEYSYHKIALR